MSLDLQEIYVKIEKLRSELTKEYEKCLEKGVISPIVIDLSQRLDQLILDYIKMSSPKD